MPNTPKRLTPEAMTRWRRKDTWTIYETAFLLCGYEPPADMRAEKQTPDEVREAAENMGRARIAGRLRTIGPEDENGRKYMFRQRDVIAWAASTYPEFLRPAVPAAQNSHTDPLPTVTLPAGTRVVLGLQIPRLIASALHPTDGPESKQSDAYQLGLAIAEHEHTEMLKEAASAGRLNLISYNGRPIPRGFLGAGVFVAVSELERYLAGLAVPIALRIGEPEVQQSVHTPPEPARADDVAPLIYEAMASIKSKGGEATPQTVFQWLRRAAEAKRPPFTGTVTDTRLHWCSTSGTKKHLTISAVRDRLRRRKKAESTRTRTR